MEDKKVLSGAGAHWEEISEQRKWENKKERQEKWRPHSAFCLLDSLKIWLHYCPGRKRVWLVSNVAQLHISSFCYGCWCPPLSLFSSPMNTWSTALVSQACFSNIKNMAHLFGHPQPLLLLKSRPVIKQSSAPCWSLPLLRCPRRLDGECKATS